MYEFSQLPNRKGAGMIDLSSIPGEELDLLINEIQEYADFPELQWTDQLYPDLIRSVQMKEINYHEAFVIETILEVEGDEPGKEWAWPLHSKLVMLRKANVS